MTRRQKIAAAIASAVTAAGVYLATGVMPAPGPGTVGVTFQARLKCGKAKKLAIHRRDVDCVAGERVYVLIEGAADLATPTDGGERVPGVRFLKGSFRRATLTHPDRALTVLGNVGTDRCLGGKVRRARGDGTFWKPKRGWGQCCGEGCECAGARCAAICPPHVYAGDTCTARICRRWPNLKGCSTP